MVDIRELKQPRRRRWVRRQVKNGFIFYQRDSQLSRSVRYASGSRNVLEVNVQWPISIHLRAAEEKQNGFCRYILTNKVTLWAASYSACVVYTKTIIHLNVGESGASVYHPPLFTSTSVNNC